MNSKQHKAIVDWLKDNGDFETGLLLFAEISPESWYFINNIKCKGEKRGRKLLVYELRKRAKVKPSSLVPKKPIKKKPVSDKRVQADLKATTNPVDKVVLRDKFPFLNADDCPDEFKILVNDMITAHAKYMGAHEHLYAVVGRDNAACFNAARDVVENRLNNVAIWNELEHYKNTGEILGIHPIFKVRMRREALQKMTADDLKKEKERNRRSISYYKRMLKERKGDDKYKEWEEAIAEKEKEQLIISQIQGPNGRTNKKRAVRKKSRKR